MIIDAAVAIDVDKIAFYGYSDTNGYIPLIFEMNLQGELLKCKYLPGFTLHNYLYPAKMVFKNDLLTFSFNDSGSNFKIFSVDTSLSQFCNAVDTNLTIYDDGNYLYMPLNLNHSQNTDDLQDDSVLISNLLINYTDCIDSTVGIGDKPYNYIVHVFPNPFTSTLTISTNDHISGELEIYDLQHRKLLSKHFENSQSINTEELIPGIYIYEITSKNEIIARGMSIKN